MQAAHATGKDRKRRRAPGGTGKIRMTDDWKKTVYRDKLACEPRKNWESQARTPKTIRTPSRGHARSRAERRAQQNPQGLRRCGRGPVGRADPTRHERTHAPSREPNAGRARRRLRCFDSTARAQTHRNEQTFCEQQVTAPAAAKDNKSLRYERTAYDSLKR